MRISKGYWLWGLFSSEEKYFLNEIKTKVQSKLKSPFFETHITLTGPYLNINSIFLHKLKNFAEKNPPITLIIDGYEFKQEKYKSFYISIKNSSNLRELRRNIYQLNNFNQSNNYSPHISLSYGNHEIKEKKYIISRLPQLNKQIRISEIALVEVDEDINLWKILERYDLK